MSKLKILHIIKSLGRGGAEMLLPETLKLHNQERFEFHYIYFLPWKYQMVEPIESAGGRVTCFSAKNNLKMLQQYKKVGQYCEDNRIDLIHCHLPWSGFLGRIIFAKIKIPVIYTEHNIQEHYHFLTKNLNKYSYNLQTLAIGVSKDVSRSIKENIDPNIPVCTLLNGVNTENFKKDPQKGRRIREELNIPPDAIVIGNIAVFREQKNLSDWLKAFRRIKDRHANIYGFLVGAGPKEEELKSLCSELHLDDYVKFTGLQTDTVSYFSAMDIFMMSSTFEGLPVALLEAMSMSCAVVSTKAGGVVEVIREDIDGLLCEVGSSEDLADKVSTLIDNREIDKYQIAARKRVKDSFSLNNMVGKLEEIYLNNIVKKSERNFEQ